MNVLIIETVINLDWCNSLKEKRRVRQGLIDRLEKRHRVSVKEVDYQDVWKTLCLGMARELEASLRTTVEEHSNGEIREWDADII
jgi:uncharacterized protein YlxP (DUF503 family)